jgi:hypothetical protein
MSTEEKESIIEELKTLRVLIKWVLGIVSTLVVGAALIAVSDHFLLAALSEDMSEVKPRVERLWWNSGLGNDR